MTLKRHFITFKLLLFFILTRRSSSYAYYLIIKPYKKGNNMITNFFTNWFQKRKRDQLQKCLTRLSEIRGLRMLHLDALLGMRPENKLTPQRIRELFREEYHLRQEADRLKDLIVVIDSPKPFVMFYGHRVLTKR